MQTMLTQHEIVNTMNTGDVAWTDMVKDELDGNFDLVNEAAKNNFGKYTFRDNEYLGYIKEK
jgi:hypothetical protein